MGFWKCRIKPGKIRHYGNWRITESEYTLRYDRYRKEQRFFDNKLKQLTKTDDDYYMQVTYLGDLSKRANELFEGSRADEKRRLLTFVLSNLKLSGKKVLYEVKKPFDTFLLCNERLSWGQLVDSFVNRKVEINIYAPELELLYSNFYLVPSLSIK